MTTQTQDLSQALVLSDSQFAPSFVEDSQPMSEMAPDSEVFASDSVYVSVVLVEQTSAAVVAAAALKLAAAKAKKDGRSNNMKWQPFMSTFVLNKMCELISSGVRTDKGFKEVHFNTVVKQVRVLWAGGVCHPGVQPPEEVGRSMDPSVQAERP